MINCSIPELHFGNFFYGNCCKILLKNNHFPKLNGKMNYGKAPVTELPYEKLLALTISFHIYHCISVPWISALFHASSSSAINIYNRTNRGIQSKEQGEQWTELFKRAYTNTKFKVLSYCTWTQYCSLNTTERITKTQPCTKHIESLFFMWRKPYRG